MYAHGQTIINYMEQFAPKHLALPDDPIGLQVGSLDKKVRNVLVALDVTEEVVKEAVSREADLIIAHHAVMYRPIRHLRTDLPAGKLYESLIKNDIAVYISHTNLDAAEGGVNDVLAEAIGLKETKVLREVHTDKLFKLVVFVPETHHEQVLDALFSAGAGWIGQYSHCSFNLKGTGTFLPQQGANPFIGKAGQLERADEIRIETIVPDSLRREAVQAMLKAHPYEEAAYDLYPLDLHGRSTGIGRIGRLDAPLPLGQFAEHVKSAYDVPAVRVVGDLKRPVRKAAVVGGAGREFVKDAKFAGADVLITGDLDYHTAHDALAAGIGLIDAGHNIEKLLKPAVAQMLGERLRQDGYRTEAIASETHTDPFQYM